MGVFYLVALSYLKFIFQEPKIITNKKVRLSVILSKELKRAKRHYNWLARSPFFTKIYYSFESLVQSPHSTFVSFRCICSGQLNIKKNK